MSWSARLGLGGATFSAHSRASGNPVLVAPGSPLARGRTEWGCAPGSLRCWRRMTETRRSGARSAAHGRARRRGFMGRRGWFLGGDDTRAYCAVVANRHGREYSMTLVAVWRTENQLMAVADTRIIRSAGNVLTEHGPKLLPVRIRGKQPGPSGFFDREAFQFDIGFAYSGATLSALSAHALASALLGNLVGQTGTPPPSMSEIANFIGGAAAEYMREVGQLTGNSALVERSCIWVLPYHETVVRLRNQTAPEPNPISRAT